jgi:phage shock protein PspC (stress-responsive transcriptional regulator)
VTKEQYSRVEKLSKAGTVYFALVCAGLAVYLGFATAISQLLLLGLIGVGLLPYLLFYNGYVRGTLWKQVYGSGQPGA